MKQDYETTDSIHVHKRCKTERLSPIKDSIDDLMSNMKSPRDIKKVLNSDRHIMVPLSSPKKVQFNSCVQLKYIETGKVSSTRLINTPKTGITRNNNILDWDDFMS